MQRYQDGCHTDVTDTVIKLLLSQHHDHPIIRPFSLTN